MTTSHQAALSTGAAFSACQFACVWCYQQERAAPATFQAGSCLLSSLASRGGEGEAVQEVFHKAALLLGDQDTALGAGSSSVRSPAARTARLALEGVWGLALPLSDSQALAGGPGARQGMISALYSSGMHHVLSRYLGEQEGSREEQEVRQECAWRLEQWEELSPDLARSSVPGCVLGALEAASPGLVIYTHGCLAILQNKLETELVSLITVFQVKSRANSLQCRVQSTVWSVDCQALANSVWPLVWDCTQIMSASFMGVCTTPPPVINDCQQLAEPPPALFQ